jgi:hypothetical protein
LENKNAERLCPACKSQIGFGGLQFIETAVLAVPFRYSLTGALAA